MKKYDLKPIYDRAKSFYGKATVTEYAPTLSILKSYDTEVLAIKNGHPVRMWGGYSVTTMRHVNEFLKQSGFTCGGKSWWDSQPVDSKNPVADIITATLTA